MQPTPVDLLLGALIFLGARAGCRRGVSDALWPAVSWTLIALLGAAAASHLGTHLSRVTPLPPLPATCLAYIGVAAGIARIVRFLETRLADRLNATLPLGRMDQAMGWCCGLLSTTAACLAAFALLNPWYVETLDWNPREMSGDQAVAALSDAIVGSLRRLILEESYLGRVVVERFPSLLIPIPG